MGLNEKEIAFIDSIKSKIKKYEIKTTLKEALSYAKGAFTETRFNDMSTEIVDIGIERFLCETSNIYFMLKYCWVDIPGHGSFPFTMYYFQKESMKVIDNTRKMIFEKTRQCGISTVTSLYCFWRCNFKDSEDIDVISITQVKAKDFVKKIDTTVRNLPEFLKTKVTAQNQKEIRWENGSRLYSESATDRAGRGDSLSMLVLDEAAFYLSERMIRGIVAAAVPTLTRTGGKTIIISTSNGTTGPGAWYYEEVEKLKLVGNSDDAKLVSIEWYEVPDMPGIKPYKGFNDVLQKYIDKDYFNRPHIKKEMEAYFAPIVKNYRNNDWLKITHEETGDLAFRQEILHQYVVSGEQVFTPETLEYFKNQIKKYNPIWENEINGMSVKGMTVWDLPKPKHRYILGIDISSGTSKDYSSIQIMDVENYEQVAEFKGMLATKTMGSLIKKVARYYNSGYVCIESNSIGEAVFNEVYYSDEDPYRNVYKIKKVNNGIERMTGWLTTSKTRQLMLNNLVDWFEIEELREQLIIKSKNLYTEMLSFVWTAGRMDHSPGCHDDTLIGFAIALFLRSKALSTQESFFLAEDDTLIDFSPEYGSDAHKTNDDFAIEFSEDNSSSRDAREQAEEAFGCDINLARELLGL